MAVFLEPTQPVWLDRAHEEINRAKELDPDLAETHLVNYQFLFSQYEGYNVEAAFHEARLANQLDPSVGHWELFYLYMHLGLEDLAKRELARGFEIDPTSDALKKLIPLMYEVQSNPDGYAADQRVPHENRPQVLYFMSKRQFDNAQGALDEWSAKLPADSESARKGVPPTKALLFAVKGAYGSAEAEVTIMLKEHPRRDPG